MKKKARINLILSEIVGIINIIVPILLLIVFGIGIFIGSSGELEYLKNIFSSLVFIFLWIVLEIVLIVLPIVAYVILNKKKNKNVYKILMGTHCGLSIAQLLYNIFNLGILCVILSIITFAASLYIGKGSESYIGVLIAVTIVSIIVSLGYTAFHIVAIVISMKNTFSKKMYEELEGGK